MNIKIDELLQRYAAGERNFQNVDVQGPCYVEGVNLHGINLSGSVLGELSLNGFNFRGATLEKVNFQSSGLRNANFEAANLSGAKLDHARLDGANFTNAILVNADLRCASMEDVNLTGANLKDAVVGGSFVPWEDIEFEESSPYLIGAIFNKTIMPDGSVRTDT